MSLMNANASLVRRFVYGAALLVVPVAAVLFLGTGTMALPFGDGGLNTQAFAPLSAAKKAPVPAKAATTEATVPVVQLDVWEYTALRISDPR